MEDEIRKKLIQKAKVEIPEEFLKGNPVWNKYKRIYESQVKYILLLEKENSELKKKLELSDVRTK